MGSGVAWPRRRDDGAAGSRLCRVALPLAESLARVLVRAPPAAVLRTGPRGLVALVPRAGLGRDRRRRGDLLRRRFRGGRGAILLGRSTSASPHVAFPRRRGQRQRGNVGEAHPLVMALPDALARAQVSSFPGIGGRPRHATTTLITAPIPHRCSAPVTGATSQDPCATADPWRLDRPGSFHGTDRADPAPRVHGHAASRSAPAPSW